VATDRHGCNCFLLSGPTVDTSDSTSNGVRCFSADAVVRTMAAKLRQDGLDVRASVTEAVSTWLPCSFERQAAEPYNYSGQLS